MELSLTIIIIIITVLISYQAFNKPELLYRFMMNPYQVAQRGDYKRFLTSGFIHANWGHLLFNMFTFYFFGSAIEALLGPVHLAALFLLAIVVSEIPTFFKHRNNPGYNSLGASGGVSAVLFCAIVFNPLMELIIFPIPIPIKAYILGPIYLIYSYYQGKSGRDNINHDAHLFGALFGVAYAFFVAPEEAMRVVDKVLHSF